MSEKAGGGDEDREDELRARGLPGIEVSEYDIPRNKRFPFVNGVVISDETDDFLFGRHNASEAACNSRLVVPSALVDPDLAEHTIATLCWSIYSLYHHRLVSCRVST